MKPLFALLLLLLTLTAEAKTHVDKINGYSVEVPAGWTAVAKSEKLVKADITAPGDAAGANIRVYDNSKRRDLPGFVQLYLPRFVQEMSRGRQLVQLGQSYTNIGAYPGYQVSYRMEQGGKPVYLLKSYLWVRGSKVYWFQCGASWPQKAKYERVLDQLAASVKFF